MPYEYLDHQADLGIRGIGITPEEAFSEGARGMLAVMADLENIRSEQEWIIHCTAPDPALLFVEWLNELLYRREVSGALFASAQVTDLKETAAGWELTGIARGEPLDHKRHIIHTEVKAATCSGLDYRREGQHYVVQCIVDL